MTDKAVDGEVISPDATISIPEEGIVLMHNGHVLAKIPKVDVELVADSSGVIFYLNMPPTLNNARLLERFEKMLEAGKESLDEQSINN